MEGLRGLTRALIAASRWMRILWPVVVAALIAAFVGAAWRTSIGSSSGTPPHVGALFLPLLKIIEHRTSR